MQGGFRENQTFTDIALCLQSVGWSVSSGWFGLTGTDKWNLKFMTMDLIVCDDIQYILLH